MKIAFYLEDADGFGWMARAFVASAKRFAPPGVTIVQLSPAGIERIEGVDTLFELNFVDALTFFGRYFASCSEYLAPPIAEDSMVRDDVMFCNVDMLFVRDFDWPSYRTDVALPHIKDDRWKWDGAMCFVPHGIFLQRIVRENASWGESLPITEQLQAIDNAVKEFDDRASVSWLQGDVWSYVPISADDTGGSTAILVHYRGNRKAWMAKRARVPYDPAWERERSSTHPGLKEKKR